MRLSLYLPNTSVRGVSHLRVEITSKQVTVFVPADKGTSCEEEELQAMDALLKFLDEKGVQKVTTHRDTPGGRRVDRITVFLK